MSAIIPEETDVVVAGGGPAGSSAAIALAGTGHRVLVLERARFPRPHIGESLPPKIEPLLAILGVDEAVHAAGFVRMSGTTVFQGMDVVAHDFDPAQKLLGYQVDRARFDAILLERARALGCTVIEGAAVVDVLRDANGQITGARWRAESGEVRSAAAKFVVDASGSRGVVSKMLGSRRKESIHTVALCAYWRDSALPREFPATNTLFEMRPDGWIWSVLLDDGRRNVTVGLDAEALKSSPKSAMEVYREAIAASHLVAPLVQNATPPADLTVHDATWFSSDLYAGEGFVLCGDAASFIDPLTSHGVYKAMHSGIVGASVINTALARKEHAAIAIAYHRDHQARTFERYSDIALTFYRGSPYAGSPFWSVRTRPELGFERAFSAEQIADRAARRTRFSEDVRRLGGRQLSVRAKPELALADRAVAEGNFIVLRPALVNTRDERFELGREQAAVDVAALFPLLDGRALEAVFEGYVAATGRRRSAEEGRRLTSVLAILIENDLIEAGVLAR